jgi:hypothetical protein
MEETFVTTPSPVRRKSTLRRLLKITCICTSLLALLVLMIPTILSADVFRRNLEEELGRKLGVDVRLENYSLSWFSGLTVEGLRVPNPAGFPQDEPLLELRSMRGDISFLQLLRGRLALSGTVEGLEIRIHQDADGLTNLKMLTGIEIDVDDPDIGRSGFSGPDFSALDRLRLDLRLVDALVEISHEEEGVLESLRNVNSSINKEFGDGDVRVTMDAEIHRPMSPGAPGRVQVTVDVDTSGRRPLEIYFDSSGLDLSRYKPLLTFALAPEQITAIEGVVNGTLACRYDYHSTVSLEGSLTIEAPRLAGAMFAGMDIRADRWVINPHLDIALPQGDDPPRLDTEGTFVDLGFGELTGISTAELQSLGREGLGLRYSVDLDAVRQFGGALTGDLASEGGTLQGMLVLPLVDKLDESFDVSQLYSEGQLSLAGLEFESFRLADYRGRFQLHDGILELHTVAGATLNSGPFQLQATADLADLTDIPLKLDLSWEQGAIRGDAVRLLRYVVPLLAGLEQGPRLDFHSTISSQLSLSGPAMPRTDEYVLEWLNRWEGTGNVHLQGGGFTPAPELQAILAATGNGARLQLDELDSSFTISNGYVETAITKLESKGRRYGLAGRTSLGGDIDYTIDVTAMLEGHRDGDRIRKALGDQPLNGALTGTLNSPELGMPDLAQLFDAVLKGVGEEALQKGILDLLKRIRRK